MPDGGGSLRSRAMSEIERVRFIPEKGRRRIGSMVEGRPDWVLSRQRAWGVPITLFVKNGTMAISAGPRSQRACRRSGAPKKASMPGTKARKAEFLGEAHNPDDYEMVADILDVWFDWAAPMPSRLKAGAGPRCNGPPTSISKGSDQHRGWFQSSLLAKLRDARPRAL